IKKTATATVVGDTDQDNTVTASDALMVLKWIVGKEKFSVQQFANSDMDGSKHIEASDALMILKKVVGKI
ncbi:MAG: dockerin type I repeat-containing protein, partial [Clostridia bacterium]|nr:dockerin type I repeat-containing protein [Clostridia bacterium]